MTNYYFVTYASIFGDDPRGGQRAREGGQGGHRRLRHRLGRDRRRRHGDQAVRAARRTASRLAAQMEKFKKVPTLSGLVSFSPTLHSVFGRQYRVITIQNNKGKRVGYRHREGRPEDLARRP